MSDFIDYYYIRFVFNYLVQNWFGLWIIQSFNKFTINNSLSYRYVFIDT